MLVFRDPSPSLDASHLGLLLISPQKWGFPEDKVLLMPGIPEGWLPPEGKKVSWLFPSKGCTSTWGNTVYRKQKNELQQKLPCQPQGENRADLDLTAAQSNLAWEE